jgi:hypothetical protein
MNLLYFSDVSQLEYVLEKNSDLIINALPITSDMTVSFELERLGIEFIDEWNFIEPIEIEKNWNEAHSLSYSWWNEEISTTNYKAEPLTKSAQQEMIYPFQACLNARTIYNRIFDKYTIKKISGYFLPNVPVKRTGPIPANRAVQSVSQAVLFYMAENRGISIEKLSSINPMSLGKINSIVDNSQISAIFENPKINESNKKEVVIVFKDGMRKNEFAQVMKILGKLKDIDTIEISISTLKYFSEKFSLKTSSKCMLNLFLDKYIQYSLSYSGEYKEIFANKFLHFQFESIVSEMKLSTDCGDIFSAFMDILNPSIVIFGHEAFTLERVLVGVAQKRSSCTIGLLHNGVMPKFSIRGVSGISNQVLVWNDFDLDAISTYKSGESKLTKIGSLEYESKYLEYLKKRDFKSIKLAKQAIKDKLRINKDSPLVLVLTAEVNTGFAAPVAEPCKHRKSIREFISFVDSRPDLQFAIKPHPSFDYYELYKKIKESDRPNLWYFEDVMLSEIIEASDICLMINYCTTASLEAMLKRIPVLYLNNAVYPLEDWRDNLLAKGVLRVSSVLEMGKEIDKLLENKEEKLQALNEADKQLKEILGIDDLKPTLKFTKFIIEILRSKDDSIEKKPNRIQTAFNLMKTDFKYEKSHVFNELIMKHSADYLMLIITYIAGLKNLGNKSIYNIYILFHEHVDSKELSNWDKARWILTPIYILATLNSGMTNGNFKSFITYLLHPHKFILIPIWLRRVLLRHIFLKYTEKSKFLYKIFILIKKLDNKKS